MGHVWFGCFILYLGHDIIWHMVGLAVPSYL